MNKNIRKYEKSAYCVHEEKSKIYHTNTIPEHDILSSTYDRPFLIDNG